MTSGLPYIPDQVGVPILLQPYVFSDATLAVFLLECKAASLNALLDTYINEPSGGRHDYRCLGVDGRSLAVMIMGQMTMNVKNSAATEYGKERYSELSFWIPCYDRNELKQGRFKPALFLPFLFLDSFSAMATGREMFGFRKQLANFAYPTGRLDPANPQFTSTTTAFKRLGPDSVAQRHGLVSLAATDPGARRDVWTRSTFAAGIAGQLLGAHWTSETGEVLGGINALLDDIPAVFLKQFPAVTGAAEAETRTITTAPFRLLEFHGGAPWLAGHGLRSFDLQFERLASHPIVAQLGLTPVSSTADADIVAATGFWVNVDFALEAGTTVERVARPRRKIAVLGGGIGSLAAVYGITEDPEWQQKYDITLYQMGWRLGGKCSSGRNRAIADRIEEHGLHVWFGYYENAFRVIQACYGELDRSANAPLATWQQAFKPHNTILVEEFVGGQWRDWALSFRPNDEVPGRDAARDDHPAAFFTHLRQAGAMLHAELSRLVNSSNTAHAHATALVRGFLPGKLGAAAGKAVSFFEAATNVVEDVVGYVVRDAVDARPDVDHFLSHLTNLYKTFPEPGEDHAALARRIAGDMAHWENVLLEIKTLVEQFLKPFAEVVDSLRRIITLLELGVAVGLGILRDGVLLGGYAAINQYDFTQWLIRNGATRETANSAIVRAFYDLYLCFPNGQNRLVCDGVAIGGDCSAGELLHSYVLVTLCYKGSIMWKMQAGMGDAVMTPLYLVLKRRGVRFEFFHKVADLRLDASKQQIGEIDVEVQATPKPNVGEYNPLYDVRDLACWPSAPLFEQLEQGQALRDQSIDLESSWTPWKPVARKTLRLGHEFDQVVLGISVAALPYITGQLADANPRWKAMLEHANSSQTQAMQLWLNINLEETGWPLASPILDGYGEPFNTWAVMDQTLDKESWPQSELPLCIAYFCNNRKDATPIPPFSDHGFPERQRLEVKEAARKWLNRYIGHLWPYATQRNGTGLDWSKLVDLENRVGEARFDGQYFRANIDPTERYVTNAANTDQFRLKTDASGFSNLFLTGDWIDNGSLNLGNVESTVISGLQCARALTGYPIKIHRAP